jgi:hypothetical protein
MFLSGDSVIDLAVLSTFFFIVVQVLLLMGFQLLEIEQM